MRSPEDEDTDTGTAEGEAGEKVMGFLDHLEELRMTLFKCVLAFVVGAVVVGFFFDEVKTVLDWPLDQGKIRSGHPEAVKVITSTLMASFSVYISIGFLGAITISMPFILFFLGQFVAPALTPKEKRLLLPAGIAALLLFLAGGSFAFFLLMPSVVDVSITANVSLGSDLMLSLDSWYSSVTWMVLGLGLAFQFPMIIQILVFLDMLEVATLRKWRRLSVVICLVAAAVITPTPDPFNMMICAAPLYLLYEAAIVVAVVYTSKLAACSRT